MHAFQITFDHSMERQPLAAPSNAEFLNMADTSIRRLVKMAKNLAYFRSLDQEDQISLLKGAVVEVLVPVGFELVLELVDERFPSLVLFPP